MDTNNSNVVYKNQEVKNNIKNEDENMDNAYEISRTYKLKKSTMKKLYQIKANEDDFNIKFNAILDSAILCYYDKLFKD